MGNRAGGRGNRAEGGGSRPIPVAVPTFPREQLGRGGQERGQERGQRPARRHLPSWARRRGGRGSPPAPPPLPAPPRTWRAGPGWAGEIPPLPPARRGRLVPARALPPARPRGGGVEPAWRSAGGSGLCQRGVIPALNAFPGPFPR